MTDPAAPSPPLLGIEGLTIALPRGGDRAEALSAVSMRVEPNEIVCVVGESGSGKSMTARSVLRLLPKTARLQGSIRFRGEEVLAMSPAQIRAMRGALVSMVFQDPMTSFNPVLRIGDQTYGGLTPDATRKIIRDLMEEVGGQKG